MNKRFNVFWRPRFFLHGSSLISWGLDPGRRQKNMPIPDLTDISQITNNNNNKNKNKKIRRNASEKNHKEAPSQPQIWWNNWHQQRQQQQQQQQQQQEEDTTQRVEDKTPITKNSHPTPNLKEQ